MTLNNLMNDRSSMTHMTSDGRSLVSDVVFCWYWSWDVFSCWRPF